MPLNPIEPVYFVNDAALSRQIAGFRRLSGAFRIAAGPDAVTRAGGLTTANGQVADR